MNIRGFYVNKRLGVIEVTCGGIVELSHTETQALVDYLTTSLPLIVEDSRNKKRVEMQALEKDKKLIEDKIAAIQNELKDDKK